MGGAPDAELRLREDATGLEATFVPGAGMICRSLCQHGVELLAQNDGVGAYADDGRTMGIPLLYPWANRLSAFEYSVGGTTVAVPRDRTRVAVDGNGLPIHGVIGGRMAWTPEPGGGADARSLAARLSWADSKPELFEVFPFRHDLRYEARLGDGRLEVEVSMHACGDDAVPVALGFHPYLAPTDAPRERWTVELPAMRRLALDASQIPVGPERALAAERFELASREFDDGFDSLAEPARFAVEDGSRRMALEFLEGYPCAQVFAPPGGAYICFEPMTAPANALRSGVELRVLAPGERYRARFRVSIERLSP